MSSGVVNTALCQTPQRERGIPEEMIFVKTWSGKTKAIRCSLQMTIGQFKLKVQDIEGIPVEKIRLIFAGQNLADERTLAEYRIEYEETIHVVGRLTGGGDYPMASFSFNKLSQKIELEYSKDGPSWLFVTKGLNLYGKCLNAACKANNQAIYIQKGIGTFHMPEIKYTAKCPECNQSAKEVTNLGFSDCAYQFNGMKKGEEKEIKAEGETIAGKYLTFAQGDNTEWLFLVITTTLKKV